MLSRVKIQNFKSIGEPGVDLELKPLTFLVGPNGGGKSSILDAITLLSQRGTSQVEFFSFSRPADLHFMQEPNTLSVEVEVYSVLSGDSDSCTLSHTGSKAIQTTTAPLPQVVTSAFHDKVYPIRATRGGMEEAQLPVKAIWVGGNGEHASEILEQLPDPRYRSKRREIQKWASEFGMRDVAATLADRATGIGAGPERIRGSYADDRLDAPLNLTFASSGSRQALPVIVQLFWAAPDSIIMIEEPEISLHPKAQIDLLEMFAEAIKQDKQIIATTHSLFMMQGIGYAVHKGWLEPDQVAVYHVEKKKGIGTTSKRLPLSDKGYIKGWVPSFAKVEGQLLREWTKNLPEE